MHWSLPGLQRLQCVAALVGIVFLSGCVRIVSTSPQPQSITLTSADGFTLYAQEITAAAPVAQCRVSRLDAIVEDVRADTVLLRSVRVRKQPRGADGCPALTSVRVLSARDTAVRSELRTADGLSSVLVFLFAVGSLAGLLIRSFRYNDF